MIYLYAITDAADEPDVPGLEGAPLHTIRDGRLAVVASEHDGLRLRAAEEELWAHETVVEALMEAGAVLPVRMGSVVENPDAVLALLRERGRDFSQALDEVRGAVEIAVRAAVDPEPAPRATSGPDAGPGAAYMLDRLDRKQRVEEAGARIHASLEPLARDHTPIASSHERMALRTAYLVDRELVDDFAETAERVGDELDGVTVACTGPWPPYSFAAGVN